MEISIELHQNLRAVLLKFPFTLLLPWRNWLTLFAKHYGLFYVISHRRKSKGLIITGRMFGWQCWPISPRPYRSHSHKSTIALPIFYVPLEALKLIDLISLTRRHFSVLKLQPPPDSVLQILYDKIFQDH